MTERQQPLIVPRGAGEYPAQLYRGAPPSVAQDTSREAAQTAKRGSHALRLGVLTFIAEQCGDGATCDQVEWRLDLRHQTAGPRIRELALLGEIVDTGIRRRTRSGRKAIAWLAREWA